MNYGLDHLKDIHGIVNDQAEYKQSFFFREDVVPWVSCVQMKVEICS